MPSTASWRMPKPSPRLWISGTAEVRAMAVPMP